MTFYESLISFKNSTSAKILNKSVKSTKEVAIILNKLSIQLISFSDKSLNY